MPTRYRAVSRTWLSRTFYRMRSSQDNTTCLSVGTYSSGGNRGPCRSCGKGETSNHGAASERECYPIQQECPPGSVSDTEFGRLLAAKNAKPAGASPAEAAVSIAAIDAHGKKVRVYRQTPPEAATKTPVNVTTKAKSATKKQTDVTAHVKQDAVFSPILEPHVTDGDSDVHGIDNSEDYVEENYYAFRDREDEEGRCVCKPGLVIYCFTVAVLLHDSAAVAAY